MKAKDLKVGNYYYSNQGKVICLEIGETQSWFREVKTSYKCHYLNSAIRINK